MEEYLTFRKMITPVIIQILFWVMVTLVVIAGLFVLTQSVLAGIVVIILGPIAVRVYAELLIVLFEINEALQDMRKATVPGAGMTAATRPPTAPPPLSTS